MRVDLNCDVGESPDVERAAAEEQVMRHVTTVSIACGFHAGDPDTMRRAVRAAHRYGVAVGAHPGFRDPEGFGRREFEVAPQQVENLVAYQVGALAALATVEGVQLSHVKPHGALYNQATHDRSVAAAIARAVATVDRRLVLFGLAGSVLVEAGLEAGLRVAEEAFADRAYRPDGTLVPRSSPGAALCDEHEVLERVLRMVRDGVVYSQDGPEVRLHADTICIHGDTPGAPRLAELIRRELTRAGIHVVAVGDV